MCAYDSMEKRTANSSLWLLTSSTGLSWLFAKMLTKQAVIRDNGARPKGKGLSEFGKQKP